MREEMNDEQRQNSQTTQPGVEKKDTVLPETHLLQRTMQKTSDAFTRRVSQFRYGSGEARITNVELLNLNNEMISVVEFNQSVKIRIYFESYQKKKLTVIYNVRDDKKIQITGSNLLLADQDLLEVQPGDSFLIEYTTRFPLQEGSYSIQVALNEPIILEQTANFFDFVDDAVIFTVSKWEKSRVFSKVYLFPSVEIQQIS